MLKAFEFSSDCELPVCDRSILVNIITNKFAALKCLTKTKIQILYDHVDRTHFHMVEMGCKIIQFLSADIVGPTMFVYLTPSPSLHSTAEYEWKSIFTFRFTMNNEKTR